MPHTCPEVNTASKLDGSFWNIRDGPLDAHKIGWIISGSTASVTLLICFIASMQHACHYHKPREQRQIIRILWMPLVFAVVSFFSYRFFRTYTYYELVIIAYEALVLMAFLALMLAYVGSSTNEQMQIMKLKEKRGLPWPLGCIRFRPSKPYFLHALNASVLQYAFLRPTISIIGMVCETYHVLCAHMMAPWFAKIYLDAVDFVSISIAFYGLVVLYVLVQDRLSGRRPVAKFLSIKLLVFFTYYQAFVFDILANQGIIPETKYWTKTNISEGLNAMAICCEMVIFSLVMWWAYPAGEYKTLSREKNKRTNPLYAFWQAMWYWDFVQDGYRGILFLFGYIRNKEGTRSTYYRSQHNGNHNAGQQFDIDAAFDRCRPEDAIPAVVAIGKHCKPANSKAGTEKPDIRISVASSAGTLIERSVSARGRETKSIAPQLRVARSPSAADSDTSSQYSQQTELPAAAGVASGQPSSSNTARRPPSRSATCASAISTVSTINAPAQPPAAMVPRPRSQRTIVRLQAPPAPAVRRPDQSPARGSQPAIESTAQTPKTARAASIIDIPSVTKAWTAAPKVPLPPIPGSILSNLQQSPPQSQLIEADKSKVQKKYLPEVSVPISEPSPSRPFISPLQFSQKSWTVSPIMCDSPDTYLDKLPLPGAVATQASQIEQLADEPQPSKAKSDAETLSQLAIQTSLPKTPASATCQYSADGTAPGRSYINAVNARRNTAKSISAEVKDRQQQIKAPDMPRRKTLHM